MSSMNSNYAILGHEALGMSAMNSNYVCYIRSRNTGYEFYEQ